MFPQGQIHFEINLSCGNSKFLSAFSHEDPGVVTVVNRLFQAPPDVLSATFSQPDDFIEQIRENIQPQIGSIECLRRCGLPIPGPRLLNASIRNKQEG
jgi:hypothetical protein